MVFKRPATPEFDAMFVKQLTDKKAEKIHEFGRRKELECNELKTENNELKTENNRLKEQITDLKYLIRASR